MAIFSLIDECPRRGIMTSFIINTSVHIMTKFQKEEGGGGNRNGTRNCFCQ